MKKPSLHSVQTFGKEHYKQSPLRTEAGSHSHTSEDGSGFLIRLKFGKQLIQFLLELQILHLDI